MTKLIDVLVKLKVFWTNTPANSVFSRSPIANFIFYFLDRKLFLLVYKNVCFF